MGIEPVAGDAMAGRETHLALIDSLHFLDDDALHAVEFLGDDIKVEFVMHLENHFGLDALVLETPVDAHLGALMALRSLKPLTTALRELMSGNMRRRP